MGDISTVGRPVVSEGMVSSIGHANSDVLVPAAVNPELRGSITLEGKIAYGGVGEDETKGYSLEGKFPFVVPKNENIVSYCVKLGNLELCAKVTKEAEPPSLMDFSIEPQIPYLRKGVEDLLFGPLDVQEEEKPRCFCEELGKLYEPENYEGPFMFAPLELDVSE